MHLRHFLIVIVAVLCVAPGTGGADATPTAPSQRTIRVSGEGRTTVRPDVATLSVGIQATGKEVGAITAEASAQMRKLLAALAKEGVPEKDVQTTRHDLAVERSWKDGRQGPITGYTVTYEVRVAVRDLAKLPAILQRVVAAGSNTLHGLSFQKEDPTPERARALAVAVGVARAKAEAIAKAAGVTLGELISVTELGREPVPLSRVMAADAGGAPVSPGEVEIAESVEVAFAVR
jgi:uncharacterized protein YggE